MVEQNTIPKGWKETTLGEVAEVLGGGTPSTKEKLYWNGDIPWISVKDLKNIERWVTETEKKITKKGKENSSTQILNTGDLIISARGTVGVLAQLKIPMAFNQSCYGLRAQKYSFNNFLYYLIKENIHQFKKNVHGAIFDTITRSTFDQISILLPPLEEQKAIAAVLSSFDDKIELLREENKTLESIAQTIFEEWFVKFNFPDENGKPYKDGGGKMINSEFGEIPEGWKVEKLTKIFDFIKGIEPGSVNYCSQKLSENYLPFYRVQNITIYGNLTNLFVKKDILKEKIFNVDDILISMDGTIGRVFIGGTGGYSSGIRKVICKKDYCSKSFILCYLKSEKFQNELSSFGRGQTTIRHAGSALKHIKLIFKDNFCRKFNKTTEPCFKKIISNIGQIQTLSILRDTFLPKLMKGKIRVRGFKG